MDGDARYVNELGDALLAVLSAGAIPVGRAGCPGTNLGLFRQGEHVCCAEGWFLVLKGGKKKEELR